jgi:hypothetical protein
VVVLAVMLMVVDGTVGGLVWLGLVWLGFVWLGLGFGLACVGFVWLGFVWLGLAWGLAWLDQAIQIQTSVDPPE